MPVIVISGKPGSGSSTTARLLAKKLKLKHFSLGSHFKKHVAKTRSHFVSMDKKQTTSQDLHKKLDAMQVKAAKKGDIVIDSKLGIKMLGNHADVRVWIKADTVTVARRLAKQENIHFSAALRQIKKRYSDEKKAFRKVYGFDTFSQEKIADIVIDSGSKTPDEIVDLITSKIKRVFVVHRWNAKPESDWYPWTKGELEKRGYFVNILKMPDTNKPQQKKWVPYLTKAIEEPNKNTFLIGHSAGVITILRYLETLKKGESVGGCVLVAGFTDDLGYKELKNFFPRAINWTKIRQRCKRFVAIHSDNDPYVKMYHGEAFRKHLGAKLVVERRKGHLTDNSKIKKLVSVVKSIEDMIK